MCYASSPGQPVILCVTPSDGSGQTKVGQKVRLLNSLRRKWETSAPFRNVQPPSAGLAILLRYGLYAHLYHCRPRRCASCCAALKTNNSWASISKALQEQGKNGTKPFHLGFSFWQKFTTHHRFRLCGLCDIGRISISTTAPSQVRAPLPLPGQTSQCCR